MGLTHVIRGLSSWIFKIIQYILFSLLFILFGNIIKWQNVKCLNFIYLYIYSKIDSKNISHCVHINDTTCKAKVLVPMLRGLGQGRRSKVTCPEFVSSA